jgi:hypothetical protein
MNFYRALVGNGNNQYTQGSSGGKTAADKHRGAVSAHQAAAYAHRTAATKPSDKNTKAAAKATEHATNETSRTGLSGPNVRAAIIASDSARAASGSGSFWRPSAHANAAAAHLSQMKAHLKAIKK